ncbi:hypothetical protein [Cloacibacillus evryensis]|uniref:hypothetical protein n=1 Tax=Cloacibacillus evryensis TaxID=508460 RepID=UPI00241FCDB5|nr:hypothetical protein [Cloacibacillus evryensis]
MGGLFGGNKVTPTPPTPSLVPEATAVSRADTSDSETVTARMLDREKRRAGYSSTMKSSSDLSASSDKKTKLGS